MYLLVDGDYFLSGFKPDSEAAVKAAVDRLHSAVEGQLLRQRGAGEESAPTLYGSHIDIRVALFSTALLNSLPEQQRGAVISVLRRMRFQCTVLESVRGRLGSPVDAALCTRAITYAMMPSTAAYRNEAGSTGANINNNSNNNMMHRASPAAPRPAFCFVTPNAYIASALELLTTRGCDVVFAVYDGDEVAEELLGYISASYGPVPGQKGAADGAEVLGGIAHMPKSEGVAFIPNTEAASAALAALQQEGKDLPLEMLTEIKRLRDSLTQSATTRSRTAAGAKEGSGDKESMVLPGRADAAAAAASAHNSALNRHGSGLPPSLSPSSMHRDRQQKEQDEEKQPLAPQEVEANKPALSDDLSSVAARRRMQVEAELITPPPFPGSKENSPVVDNKLSVGAQAEAASAPPSQLPTAPPSVPTNAAKESAAPQDKPQADTATPPSGAADEAGKQGAAAASTGAAPTKDDDILAGLLSQLSVESRGPTSGLTHTKFIPTPVQQEQPQPQPQIQVLPQPQTPAMLPVDWEERIDPRTGRKFYVNHRTRQTTWTLPASANATPQPQQQSQQHAAAEALPMYWEQRIDPRTGKTFYVNHQTRETSWARPTMQQQQAAAQLPKVAWPWEARIDPSTNRTYYINHQTRKTSWTLPSQ